MPEILKLTPKELNKVSVIKQLEAGTLKQVEAAESLGITDRQVRRLLNKYRTEGAEGFASKLRGKPSNNKLDTELKDRIIKRVRDKYPDFGPTFAAEKLEELDGLEIAVSTLRRAMIAAGVWGEKKQKKPIHRTRRPRKACYGDMEQFDGSRHDWFEGRYNHGEYTTLLARIDDATSKVNAWFSEYEGTVPVMKFWWRYFKRYGKPQVIYLDQHSTYKVNSKNALDDDQMISQFTRAMNELGVQVIHAHSPQAKGRVERLFGTLQDRLVKELRLAGINNPTDAHEFLQGYLPKFNARFNVEPSSSADTHRALSRQDTLAAILSEQATRTVSRDFVVRFKNYWYQLHKEQPTTVLPGVRVVIEERLDDTRHIRLRDKYLTYTRLAEQPPKSQKLMTALTPGTLNATRQLERSIKPQSVKPSSDHPWRKFMLLPYNITNKPTRKNPSKKWP